MVYLDLSNCNFYKDNFLHVLPKVNTIWLYDFFSYCRNYRKAWTQILNLIVNIKVYKDEVLWEEVKEEEIIGSINTLDEELIKENLSNSNKKDIGESVNAVNYIRLGEDVIFMSNDEKRYIQKSIKS